MNNLSDQELVAYYVNSGNNYYFAQLYTRHRQGVYKKCLFFTGNVTDSEDFTQDIFIRLSANLKSYKYNAKFTTWLHAVTVNYCITQLHKQKKAQASQYNYLLDLTHVNNWDTGSDETYIQTFEQVIELLPKKKRDLLITKYKAGVKITDMALDYNLKPSAVKMQLKRARDYARNLYNKISAEEE